MTFRVLITAGPTHEPIDAVRYIGNRSSGKMGLALANATLRRGWPTTLLLGPTAINPPDHSQLTTIRFQSAADLRQLLAEYWPKHDVLFMAAAVAVGGSVAVCLVELRAHTREWEAGSASVEPEKPQTKGSFLQRLVNYFY